MLRSPYSGIWKRRHQPARRWENAALVVALAVLGVALAWYCSTH